MNLISTTQLAEENGFDRNEMFRLFVNNGWIYQKEGKWHLTREGQIAGGEIKYNPKFGEYIVWPKNLDFNKEISLDQTINATKIGEQFSISNRKVNLFLAELGWIESDRGGWISTNDGKKNGAIQMEAQNGKPYIIWNKEIINNQHLIREIKGARGDSDFQKLEQENFDADDFRKKFPAKLRTPDGHFVRSRAELLIDDFLYKNSIVHAYEKKLNIDEVVYCDFFIPFKRVYIEYWGLEENKDYVTRKKEKLEIYAKYKFNLVELNDSDIENLDERIASKLRKYDINVD